MRRRLTSALLALLTLTASGCLGVTARIDVHDERQVTITLEVLPDKAGWDALGGEGRADAVAEEIGRLAGSTFHVERIDGERAPGIRVTWTDAPIAALTQPLPYGGTTVGPVFQRFVVRHDLDTDSWQLDAVLAPLAPTLVALTSGVRGAEGNGAAGNDEAVMLTVAIPGRVMSTNADERDRTSATWTVGIGSGPVPLDMRTEPGLGISPVVIVIVGLVMLIGVGVLLVVWSDRGRVRHKLERAASRAAADRAAGTIRPTGRAAATPKPPRSRRRAARARSRTAATVGSAADAGAPKGMYQDVSGDESVALPVGGAAWGPAPPPPQSVDEPAPAAAVLAASPSDGPAPAAAVLTPSPYHGDAPAAVAEPAPVAVARPGWYPDPERTGGRRFWDGSTWTDQRA